MDGTRILETVWDEMDKNEKRKAAELIKAMAEELFAYVLDGTDELKEAALNDTDLVEPE